RHRITSAGRYAFVLPGPLWIGIPRSAHFRIVSRVTPLISAIWRWLTSRLSCPDVNANRLSEFQKLDMARAGPPPPLLGPRDTVPEWGVRPRAVTRPPLGSPARSRARRVPA